MSSWEELAAARASVILGKIPSQWRLSEQDIAFVRCQTNMTHRNSSFLNKFEKEISHIDPMLLLEKIRNRTWRIYDVVKASCKIACISHQINPCLLNILVDEALRKASLLDAKPFPHGPLHGLPISVKDQFHVKGSDTTMGYVGWIGTFEGDKNSEKIGEVDSEIVAQLEELGAIVFCKTSLPQTVLYDETINHIIGQTLNPINSRLSCGGSSGGEAALIAMGGSSLGLGTDIAGSVRVPAAFCGIYGIKPSHGRFSYRGVANTNPGQTLIPSVVGFLSTSIAGLELVMASLLLLAAKRRGESMSPSLWNGSLNVKSEPPQVVIGKGTLRFGIMWCDGMVQPHPPIRRALKMVVKALQAAGHEVVEWNPPSHSIAARLHPAALNADGHHDIQKQLALSGEPLIDDLKEWYKLKQPMSLLEYQDLALQIRDYKQAYDDYWESTADENDHMVDAVLMPAAPHAAVIPGKWVHLAYTEVLNLLDYTSLVIPVTHADKHIDLQHSYVPRNENDRKNWTAYDKDIYHGAPVGIQIVGRVCEEEKLIKVGKFVELALKEEREREMERKENRNIV